MERYSTLGLTSAPILPEVEVRLEDSSPSNVIPFVPRLDDPLRFPGEDGGQSLAENAERDLDAALQLLAERARYITDAAGVAIALRNGEGMTCRASTGNSAPELGAYLDMSSGLSAESARRREILCCEDAATDPRVNRESCIALGIVSVLVLPLVRDAEVLGIFELFSSQPHAFGERDFAALERLGEMILTAIGHAEAAHRAEQTMGRSVYRAAELSELEVEPEVVSESLLTQIESLVPGDPASGLAPGDDPVTTVVRAAGAHIRKCAACGFPISGQREYCLDCEPPEPSAGAARICAVAIPGFLDSGSQPGTARISSRVYLLGSLLMTLLTLAAFVWLR